MQFKQYLRLFQIKCVMRGRGGGGGRGATGGGLAVNVTMRETQLVRNI